MRRLFQEDRLLVLSSKDHVLCGFQSITPQQTVRLEMLYSGTLLTLWDQRTIIKL